MTTLLTQIYSDTSETYNKRLSFPVAVNEALQCELWRERGYRYYSHSEPNHRRLPQYELKVKGGKFGTRVLFKLSAETIAEAVKKVNKRLPKEYHAFLKEQWDYFMLLDQQATFHPVYGGAIIPDEHAEMWAQHTHQPHAVEPAAEDATPTADAATGAGR